MAKNKKTADLTPSKPEPQEDYDAFRELGARSTFQFAGNLTVWPYLAAVFVLVWLIVLYLMAPSFLHDWTRYWSMRYARSEQPQKAIPYLLELRDNALQNAKEQAVVDKVAYNEGTMDSPTYCRELGSVYGKLNQWDKSLEWLLKAQAARINTSSDDTGKKLPPYDFSTEIGIAYFKLNQLDNAENALQDALQFNSLDQTAQYYLGEVNMAKGDYLTAVDRFKSAAGNASYRKKILENYRVIEQHLLSSATSGTLQSTL